MNELVSIIVPIYNMGNSLERCVNSLLMQDYSNTEILLVDDGSKDNSLEVCYTLQDKDSRIRVFHTENQGSGPARNVGIRNARGEYLYFLDADDELKSNAISIMIDAVENGDYDTVVFGYQSIDVHGNISYKKNYPNMIKNGNEIRSDYSDYVSSKSKYGIQGAPWNKLFSRKIIITNNIEYPPLRRHQDDAFIGRYMCYAEKIHFIEDVLYTHYLNDLAKEWDKYPVDYIESVIGLYQIRKETILRWNENDIYTKKTIEREYICNVIKALELSFSPKMQFTKLQRSEWVSSQLQRSHILMFDSIDILGRYQKTIMRYLKKGKINTTLFIMKIKIEFEKRGIISSVRRVLNPMR